MAVTKRGMSGAVSAVLRTVISTIIMRFVDGVRIKLRSGGALTATVSHGLTTEA